MNHNSFQSLLVHLKTLNKKDNIANSIEAESVLSTILFITNQE